MKIVQYCTYTGPAKGSMGSERVVEALTKGLIKLGHEVVMYANPDSTDMPTPVVTEVPRDFDVIHGHGVNLDEYGLPWVSTVHGGGMDPPDAPWKGDARFICISDYIRKVSGNPYFVHNCITPEDFIFREKKDNYFLWMAGTDWGENKGLFSAISLAKKLGFKLKIAGIGRNQQMIDGIKSQCNSKIEYVGAVNGKDKAEILANAKAVLNIGKMVDAFCLVSVEALISGTPVIARNIGAHPEILSDKVAFLCNSDNEIIKSILQVDKIESKMCREYALKRYSNIVAAKKYLQYYSNVIDLEKVNQQGGL